MQRLQTRSIADDQGFTLVELLVVILIIGILAAIAIPGFLSQKSKGYDAAAKEMAHTAQLAIETYTTDHNGEYTGLNEEGVKKLHEYDATIPVNEAAGKGGAWLESVSASTSNIGEYEVTAVADNTKDKFIIKRSPNGEVKRECKVGKAGAKTCSGLETSTW